MVEAAEERMSDDVTMAVHVSRTLGRLEFERATRSRRVVVVGVLQEHSAEMAFVQRDDVVRALPRSVPTRRSAIAFAFGARIGVKTVSIPIARALAMKSPP